MLIPTPPTDYMRARGTEMRPMRAQRRPLPERQENGEGVQQQEAEQENTGRFLRHRSGRRPEDRGQARGGRD